MKQGWKIMKLGDICEIARGGSPRPIQSYLTDEPNGVNWIKIGDTEVGGKYISFTKERIKREGMRSSRYVEVGDFLLSNSMSFGRPYILKVDGCIHDGWLVIKNYKNTFIQDFLYYLLLSPNVAKQFEEGARGSTVRNLNTNIVSQTSVIVPPLSEQQRIVALLDAEFAKIDTLKANAEKNLQNAKDLFQAALKKELEPKEGWEWSYLPSISENLDSKRIPITQKDRIAGVYPYYGASGIVDYVSEYLFDDDLLLISEDGANLLARSTPIAFSVSGKVWVNNHAHILKFKDMATQKIVEYYFASIFIDEYITGAAQPKLTQANMNKIAIPLPPTLTDQQSIVSRLDTLNEKCKALQANYEKTLSLCDDLKQALLRKAFNGEI